MLELNEAGNVKYSMCIIAYGDHYSISDGVCWHFQSWFTHLSTIILGQLLYQKTCGVRQDIVAESREVDIGQILKHLIIIDTCNMLHAVCPSSLISSWLSDLEGVRRYMVWKQRPNKPRHGYVHKKFRNIKASY